MSTIEHMDQATRNFLFKKHPMIRKKYLVVTPVIKQIFGLLRDRIFMRSTGTFMYATSRMGKTTCSKAVNVLLVNEFPDVFILNFIASKRKRNTEPSVLAEILRSEGLPTPQRADASRLQQMLITYIESKLSELGGDQFVLVVDEMQLFNEADYETLATLHNNLEAKEKSMSTIGFGDPRLMHFRSSLVAIKHDYIVARFLSQPIPFKGCASEKDFEEILIQYDGYLTFPSESVTTYTDFFLPKAYSNGFRLSSHTHKIWSELESAANGSSENSIPMLHITATVEDILVRNRVNDSPTFELTPKLIKASISASGLKNFTGAIGSNE